MDLFKIFRLQIFTIYIYLKTPGATIGNMFCLPKKTMYATTNSAIFMFTNCDLHEKSKISKTGSEVVHSVIGI